MDSYSARANSIFCTFVTVLGTTAVMNHLTTWLPNLQTDVKATIQLGKVHDLTVNTYYNMDQCTLSFDADLELESEFHWNMNQLFLYLVATYNDTSNMRNEVTIWDDIVTRSNMNSFKSSGPKMIEYPLRDQFKELRGRDIRLHVRYRTMPITGFMYMKEVATVDFKTDNEYFRRDDGQDEGKTKKKKKKSIQ